MAEEPRLKSEVRAFRQRQGWSQEELARRAGISRAGLSAIETGRLVPSTAAALALARALNCSVEDLFRLAVAVAPGEGDACSWAWPPPAPEYRYWKAEVGGKIRTFPVERSPLGLLAQDGVSRASMLHDHPQHAPERTLVVACCDPAAGLLAQELAASSDVRLIVLQRSSQAALDLLVRGLIHAAGVHLARADEAESHRTLVREKLASPSRGGLGFGLLHVADWDEGLALRPGLGVRSVRDALGARLRWVLREEGSAARTCLDELLDPAAGASARRRGGLAFDHRGVAEAIRGGWADAGVCLRLAGAESGLDFLSVRKESYDLCFTDSLAGDPRLDALVRAVRSAGYRRLLGELPGYDVSRTGELERVRRKD